MSKTIGIFMAGQAGDIMSAMSVLHYKEELWGKDCRIVWYAAKENFDLFAHQDIEVREFPRGFGYPERTKEENQNNEGKNAPLWEDWFPLVNEHNHLNLELKKNYSSLADIDYGYWPAPHQMSPQQRHGLEYPNVSKKVFGVPYDWAWHPVLAFSDEEIDAATEFMYDSFIDTGKIIAIETMAGSGQSILSDTQVRKSMQICNEVLGQCNFIFVSHKYLKGNELFPEDLLTHKNNFFCSDFTVRQCALIVDMCDMMISVSSGITVAASCWGNTAVPIIQYTGSTTCSTRAMALGRFELITTDDNPMAENQYYEKLRLLLNEIK